MNRTDAVEIWAVSVKPERVESLQNNCWVPLGERVVELEAVDISGLSDGTVAQLLKMWKSDAEVD